MQCPQTAPAASTETNHLDFRANNAAAAAAGGPDRRDAPARRASPAADDGPDRHPAGGGRGRRRRRVSQREARGAGAIHAEPGTELIKKKI